MVIKSSKDRRRVSPELRKTVMMRGKHQMPYEYRRNWYLGNKYGITTEQYCQLLETQKHKCAICGCQLTAGRNGAQIDHDHITGKIRGILCHKCNKMLGLVQDQPTLLESAIHYLV